MKKFKLVLAGLGLTLLLGTSIGVGQSLGHLARELAEQRSKQPRKPLKVYTNENLPARPPGEGPTAAAGIAAPPPPGPSSAQPGPETKPAEAAENKPEDKKKTQEYWQAKFKAARLALAGAEEAQQLAEDELSLLQIQQARELNPEVQSDVGKKIPAKTSEVEAKRAATEKARKTLEELEKEFKESGAPEEWSKTESLA